MECPACRGLGCKHCDEGQVEITQCPIDLVTQDVMDMITLAELYEKGLPPIAGGSLDQTVNFVAAAEFIWNENRMNKAKLGIRSDEL